jgi:hypothetical protein
MLMKLAQQAGTIRRTDVIDLCKIGPHQASRLLDRLEMPRSGHSADKGMTVSQAHQDPGRSKPGKETPAALGAGTGLGPPAVVVERFWKTCGERVPEKAGVFTSATLVDAARVRDALGNPLLSKGFPSPAFLFFVDLEPEANWAHACAYAFVAETGETAWCDARWPPRESIPLIRKDRP